MKTNRIIITLYASCSALPHALRPHQSLPRQGCKPWGGSGKQGREGEIIASECGPISQFFLYLCALEFPPAAVLASAILYLGKNQLEIEYEF